MERRAALPCRAGELEAKQRRRRNRGAVRTTGECKPVVEDEADDLTEAKCDNGEIVTMHFQHREGEDHSAKACQERRNDKCAPETEAEILRSERQKIGADGIKGDKTEVEQPGKANDDIQA